MKHSINGSEAEYDDYDNENENENDNDNDNDSNDDTARLNENVMALQRVKSLTERNRMVRHLYIFIIFTLIPSWCPIYLTYPQRL
jgi:DNA-directed RNA polymerase specialized sigma subunit